MSIPSENQIIDAENYRGNYGEGLSFKQIVLTQLQRVVINMSKEMRAGFWVYSSNPSHNNAKIKYIGDSRKELLKSTDCLHDLLLPKFDEEMTEQSKILNKEFDEWRSEWLSKGVVKKEEGTSYWEKSLRIYRKLFQQLCLFLERFGWLESAGVEE